MHSLHMDFYSEEIKQPETVLKLFNKAERQIVFFYPKDFPEINIESLKPKNKNTKLVILCNGDSRLKNCSEFEVLDINCSKILLQNQLSKIYSTLKESTRKDDQTDILSDREKIVMRQLVLGFTNKEIADRLFISPHTVIAHRKNITGKLGIKSVPGLTIYAILHKIISEEDIKKATQQSDTDTHK